MASLQYVVGIKLGNKADQLAIRASSASIASWSALFPSLMPTTYCREAMGVFLARSGCSGRQAEPGEDQQPARGATELVPLPRPGC